MNKELDSLVRSTKIEEDFEKSITKICMGFPTTNFLNCLFFFFVSYFQKGKPLAYLRRQHEPECSFVLVYKCVLIPEMKQCH